MARRGNTRIIRTILGLIFGLGFAGYMIWALRTEEAFRVVSKKLEQTSAGMVVSGEIYNASETMASVNVEVAFFGSDGRKLAEEVVELPHLPIGSSASFRTQPKRLSDVKDYSIYLYSGRNMYGN
jgi:hypothetical protein